MRLVALTFLIFWHLWQGPELLTSYENFHYLNSVHPLRPHFSCSLDWKIKILANISDRNNCTSKTFPLGFLPPFSYSSMAFQTQISILIQSSPIFFSIFTRLRQRKISPLLYDCCLLYIENDNWNNIQLSWDQRLFSFSISFLVSFSIPQWNFE